ncbi:transporter substrate-binding domain-containing protein [Massilia glaciei]|nr:transporter substrate-binding domain-containing protein [Massilia glaciei]
MTKSIMFLFAFMLAQAGQAAGGDTAPRQIRVAGDADWLPSIYRAHNGEARGGAIALLDKLAAALKVDVLVERDKPWARQLHEVETGRHDLVAGLYRTSQREAKFVFSEPYATEETRIFVPSGSKLTVNSLADLVGKVGVMPPSASFGAEFDQFARNHLRIREIRDIKIRLQLLSENKVDFMVFAKDDGLQKIKQLGFEGKIVVLPLAVATNDVCFAFSRRTVAQELLPRINELIRKMRGTGELDKLITAHNGAQPR